MSSPQPNAYRFADLTLDVGQRRVLRGEVPVALSRLSYELLRVLVETAPNVVSHEELAKQAWGPRRVVTPENLAKRVMLLRQALGDSADQSRYVEGVRGHGYRLIPMVSPAGGASLTRSPGNDSIRHEPSALGPREPSRWRTYTALSLLGILAGLAIVDDVRLRSATRAAEERVAQTGERPFSFVLSAPRDSSFEIAPAAPVPALSPNGKRLAFIARRDTQPLLWIQTLGELEAQAVPGTEWAQNPFWSPDGQFIAFAQGGRLKRVATEGGGPQDLAPLPESLVFYGGAWAPDGAIVLSGDAGLHRVTADGTTQPLTIIDESRQEVSHRFPVFLPDGERFVCLVLSAQPEHQGIYLTSLGNPQLKTRVVASSANAELGIGPDGRPHLVFLNDALALVAQPFDVALGRLTESPVVIASHLVEPGPSVREAAFTVSGRTLVYRPRFAPLSRLVWLDRRGVRVSQLSPAHHSYRFPTLSDDGMRLMAARDDALETAGLWWFDLRGHSDPERLTRVDALMSAWDLDNQSVVYSAPLPAGWQLLGQPVDGRGDAKTLFKGTTPIVKRIRDVTEEFLLFQGSDDNLWLSPRIGEGTARQLMQTPGLENHGRVSPDGRWLAFSTTDANETRVYVTTFPEPTELWLVSAAGGSDPQWRADGHELYYIAPDDTLVAVAVETYPEFAISARTTLFDVRFDPQSRAYGSAYASTPDGERFIVAELAEHTEPQLVVTHNWTKVVTRP